MAASRLAAYLAHCPVPLDPHHKARIKPITMKEYKRQTARFVNWLDGRGYAWDEFWELDLFIVFYKQSNLAAVSKGDFQTLVAAIEFAMPPVKGHLAWTHAALEGWGVAEEAGAEAGVDLPPDEIFLARAKSAYGAIERADGPSARWIYQSWALRESDSGMNCQRAPCPTELSR